MSEIIYGRTFVTRLDFFVAWSVMYRKKVLAKEVSEYLSKICREIAEDKGFSVLDLETYDQNYVCGHISIPPKMSVTQAVKYLKGISGRLLLKEYSEIYKDLWHGRLWNGSYYAESLGSTHEESVRKYIERQILYQT